VQARRARNPLQVGRGDDSLCPAWQGRQQGVAPFDVQFAKDVVDQEDGRRSEAPFQEPRRAKLQRENQRALLPFTGVIAG
jgi:hypothetical protein